MEGMLEANKKGIELQKEQQEKLGKTILDLARAVSALAGAVQTRALERGLLSYQWEPQLCHVQCLQPVGFPVSSMATGTPMTPVGGADVSYPHGFPPPAPPARPGYASSRMPEAPMAINFFKSVLCS